MRLKEQLTGWNEKRLIASPSLLMEIIQELLSYMMMVVMTMMIMTSDYWGHLELHLESLTSDLILNGWMVGFGR